MAVGGSSLKTFAALLVAAAAVLLVLLWHASPDPTVSAASPAPNSTVFSSTTTIAAEIRGTSPLVAASLRIDGHPVTPVVTQLAADFWRVSYQAEVSPGRHAAVISVRDDHGRTQTFAWTFVVAGFVSPLEISTLLPAPASVVAAGSIEFGATVSSQVPVAAATLRIGDREVPLEVVPSAPTSDSSLPAAAHMVRLVTSVSLPPGRYQVELLVRAASGQAESSDWTITVAGAGA